MNPEANPHVYDMDDAGYMTVQQAQQQSKATSNEKSASDCNKNTSIATNNSKSMPCSVFAVVIACFSILVALGAMGIAVSTMVAIQSQVKASMDTSTETNSTCLCMFSKTVSHYIRYIHMWQLQVENKH